MRWLILPFLLWAAVAPAEEPDFAALRAELVEEVRLFARYTGDDAFSDAVLGVIGAVERHRFVPPGEVRNAYENRPLPIGHGQTIYKETGHVYYAYLEKDHLAGNTIKITLRDKGEVPLYRRFLLKNMD